MKIFLLNLGCKVNHVEVEEYAAKLLAAGHTMGTQTDADVIIINTCTVTGEAERKTRKAVNHALRTNDHALVVLTGCSVAINPQTYLALSNRVAVIPKHHMDEYLGLRFAAENPDAPVDVEAAAAGSSLFRSRSGIRIQDGCDNDCTYCIVHTARGEAYSLPRAGILQQAEALLAKGLHELVLSGINLGSFHDEKGGLASLLVDLLALMDAGHYDARIRLSSIEPMNVDDDLIDLLATTDGRICRHLHIPLQAGSSKVLAEMNRHYDAPEFLALVERLRATVPALSLSTDVIVGFPGETDKEFEETLQVCRQAAFSKIHVFPYSMRQGTPAAARKDQVPPAVKEARAARLRALSDELRDADYARRVGTDERVIVEGKGYGMTESYHRVAVPEGTKPGSLITLTLPC